MTEDNRSGEDRLLTYQECADRIGVTVSTLRRMVREGKIPVITMSHQLKRFHYPTVLKHLNPNPKE